jgi:hypothetical protein
MSQSVKWVGMVLLALSGSLRAANPTVTDTGYEIIDMIVTPSLYWIDKDRLLFAGMKAGNGPRPDLRKLYLWEDQAFSGSAGHFCGRRLGRHDELCGVHSKR